MNVGTYDEYIARPLHWRITLRRKIRKMTKGTRESGTLTGNPRIDKKLF